MTGHKNAYVLLSIFRHSLSMEIALKYLFLIKNKRTCFGTATRHSLKLGNQGEGRESNI